MKRTTYFAAACALLFLCVFSSGCTPMRSAARTDLLLGTIIDITIYGRTSQETLDAAADAAMARAKELEQIFSATLEDSELSYVNQNAANAPVTVSRDMYTVLERSLYFAHLSDGAFDPTLGRLIKLWGIGTKNAAVPSEDEIQPLIGQKNYEHVVLNETAQTVSFTTDNFELDLGAIAKGYAADEMKKLLTDDYNITCGLLNLGGNVITIGERYDGGPWSIGIADLQAPQDTANPALILEITDETIVTSGNYQRCFTAPDGTLYHHILDGNTGFPADTGLASVSILTDCSMDADALSTAAFVLGEQKARALLSRLDGIDAVFIDTQGQITTTAGIDGR